MLEQRTSQLADDAVELAATFLRRAVADMTRQDRRQAALMAGMLERPANLAFTLELADQVFRPRRPARVARLLRALIDRHGIPTFLRRPEQAALAVGVRVAGVAGVAAVPAIRAQVRAQSSDLILDAAPKALGRYLARRKAAGFDVNVNLLGEAVLGDAEAERRMLKNLELIRRDDVRHTSVKISSIVGRLRPHAFESSLDTVSHQLRRIYRQADASQPRTFVNLDMEAYEDLQLTVDAFRRVLSEPEFRATYAGLVLQAYLPDSHDIQESLTEWALRRIEAGGAPIRIRLVKGANLGMERVTAEMNGWRQAPYGTKEEVDASFKRMVMFGIDPGRARAVHLGIGSHNLFDLAFANVAARTAGSLDHVAFEMLQGMAPHQARSVRDETSRMMLYAPTVADEDFVSAVAYLARRLEENTDEANYLRHVFTISPGNDVFLDEAAKFRESVRRAGTVAVGRGRTQLLPGDGFSNASNTDFTDPAVRRRLTAVLEQWAERDIETIPIVVDGVEHQSDSTAEGVDPSRPAAPSYTYHLADDSILDSALATARRAQGSWAERSVAERRELLLGAAQRIEMARLDLIAGMVRDGGKRTIEADAEVSEAVDMAAYYARALDDLGVDDCRFLPLGVVALAPPWNFPVAIPAGGILSALMAGNSVIFKPAPEAVLSGWQLTQILWEAGIPRGALQFVPTADDAVGRRLIESADGVILTGSYDTGLLFTSWKPDMRLFAETSGKNALIITATADLDQAIADLVDSAFGHAGQKCSAASLALVEGEVYDAPEFRRQLADAVTSLAVGSAWDPSNDVTPLIGPPSPVLNTALTTVEPGEEWLVEPARIGSGAWSPGVRMGVQPGSFLHGHECFGPVLGIMRVDGLEDAIEAANASSFGLTGGLHSLDEEEIATWIESVEVGNAYVNRTTTGAVVQRQPFGGWKQSVFGPAAKAGGPNYVLQLGTWTQAGEPSRQATLPPDIRGLVDDLARDLNQADARRLRIGAGSLAHAWQHHYSLDHDPSRLVSESNIYRYRPVPSLVLRVTEPADLAARIALIAAALTDQPMQVSAAPGLAVPSAIVEDDRAFADRLKRSRCARVRHLGPPTEETWRAARHGHSHIADDPVLLQGRLELRHYLREQSVTRTLHRHGMIPPTQ